MRDQLGPDRVGDALATQALSDQLEEAPRQLRVEVLEGRVGLQRLPEEDPVQGGLLLDEAEERLQRLAQRVRAGGGALDAPLQLLGRGVDDRLEELPLAVEVLVEQRLRNARRGRDVTGRGR